MGRTFPKVLSFLWLEIPACQGCWATRSTANRKQGGNQKRVICMKCDCYRIKDEMQLDFPWAQLISISSPQFSSHLCDTPLYPLPLSTFSSLSSSLSSTSLSLTLSLPFTHAHTTHTHLYVTWMLLPGALPLLSLEISMALSPSFMAWGIQDFYEFLEIYVVSWSSLPQESCIYTCHFCPRSINIHVKSSLSILFHQQKNTDFPAPLGLITSPPAQSDWDISIKSCAVSLSPGLHPGSFSYHFLFSSPSFHFSYSPLPLILSYLPSTVPFAHLSPHTEKHQFLFSVKH